jgi:DNA repair protein RadC
MTIKLTPAQKIQVLNSADIYKVMQQILLRAKKIDRIKEHFWLVCLSASDHILLIELISLGSIDSTLVSPMEVFSFALQKGAAKLIMVHNHPSGSLKPSKADEALTEKMMAIGNFLKVPVVDHLIITEKGHYSFSVSGLLTQIEEYTNIDLTFERQETQARHLQRVKDQLLKHNEQQLLKQKIKTAKSLLKNGVDVKTVAKSTGLKLGVVRELAGKLQIS